MKLIKKYRILLFIIFTYILTWIGGTIFFNAKVNELLPQGILIFLKIIFIPSIIAPLFIAIVMKYIENGKNGIKELLKRFFIKKTKLYWYLIAIVIPIFVYFMASIIDSYRGVPFLTPFGNADYSTIFIIIQTFVLAGIAEEMGWRGYLQYALQKKYNSVIVSVFIGVVVAIWHLPLFFAQNDIHSNTSFISFFFLMIAISFLYTWFMDNTHSVLIVALFHTSHDVASTNFSQAGHFSATLIYGIMAIIVVIFLGLDKFTIKAKIS